MKALTLKHLRYFEALATHGHFGKAAAASAISQPALSIQIKELEAIMGGPLVERAARETRLTALGEDVLSHGREILMRVEDLGNLVQSPSGPLSGRLRIGVIPTVAPYLLPSIIKALSQRFPQLTIEPKETITESVIREILDSRLDVGVVALPVSEPSLREFSLFNEDFLLVRPAQDASLPIPSSSQLRTMRLLLLEEGHCFRDQALSFCSIRNIEPQQIMEGSSLSTLVQMVGAGIGVTLIPEMAVGLETRSADVSIARFQDTPPARTIGLVWRKTNPLSENLLKIGAIVRKTAEENILHAGQNGQAIAD
ncbi:LysR family transcriptional regulator [Ruegeria sp. HKCCD4884]|uniref:hydrogen peroxide-inducible genes activator n=1 Tax=Ruegeria sp. HKCCD4884 TaxID=2683022 RepID=UPI0014910805|nr:hydrogen peroxide-inducible genes activator [Ruegeria sp. HKCCD4884]NOD93806.1 LysR family transcriptional regulator [Ruegeria sp. HKCCD4884]